jgi:uncharacterized protein YlxP (DUF503 family)
MIIGTLEIGFALYGCRSLKEKRSILRRIIERTQNRFKVSIAEVDHQDLPQSAKIGIAYVSNCRNHANSVLSKVVDSIKGMHLADMTHVEMSFF